MPAARWSADILFRFLPLANLLALKTLFQQWLFYPTYLLFIFPLCTSVCRLLDWSKPVHLFTLTPANYHVVLQPFPGAAYAGGASVCQTFSVNGLRVPQMWNHLNSETVLIIRPTAHQIHLRMKNRSCFSPQQGGKDPGHEEDISPGGISKISQHPPGHTCFWVKLAWGALK